MSQKLQHKKVVHWPTLNTVIMVEDTIKKSNNSVVTIAELKRELPRQVNHNTLIIILEYLDRSGKIAIGIRGITWIQNEDPRLKKAIAEGFEV